MNVYLQLEIFEKYNSKVWAGYFRSKIVFISYVYLDEPLW